MAQKSLTIDELAALTGATVSGDGSRRISGVADLESAGPADASFLNKLQYGQTSRYEKIMQQSGAGVIFIHPDVVQMPGKNYLLAQDPSRAFQTAIEAFHRADDDLSGFRGIHATAVIHPTASVDPTAHVGPYTVIDKNAVVGPRTSIGSHVSVGPGATIGSDCFIYPHATIRERCTLGNRVVIQPGAVIGSCGFGYTTNKEGHHVKLNQVGTVAIEDDAEIGANTAIDRSRFKATRIGRGSKIDNLVQIAHGVEVGQDNFIVSQSGIAGSCKTGRHVVLAGQCGLAGHIELGDGVILTAKSGVDKSLPNAGKYGGSPVLPLAEYNRMSVHMRRLGEYAAELKALSKRLAALEER